MYFNYSYMEEKNNPQENIPTSKVERAVHFVKTGVKVGSNYVKHYAKKIVNPSLSKDDLHQDNAADIYNTLSKLKGSALKVAQMMSMDKNLLPRAYTEKFQMAQYAAPPLSYPLVQRTFQRELGKSPTELFDSFSKEAVNAASIGQVHQAELRGKKLAVKVQYPGVADSVSSDLKLVKPFAINLLGLSERDVEYYMDEVETMLLAETDYELELKRSVELSKACAHIPDLVFTHYYPEYSSKRILTMDWLEGMHLQEFLQTNPSEKIRNQIGQALWRFYDFQIHTLLAVHADPHPGNFLMRPDGTLGIIDFGCVKIIPKDFYDEYFGIVHPKTIISLPEERLREIFTKLNFLYPDDPEDDKKILTEVFVEMITLLSKPFLQESFDFGDEAYFASIYAFGEQTAKIKPLRESKKARGSRHGLYINRTYFGLYNLLHALKATIRTESEWKSKF
ncbi:MAG: AarF/ABC1/UbiB kinase family protein [Flammeovirgaceae bacterium]|nr:AarF/ABC1/UbiB kinase family protein [Flammeovirgaceae bacterium]